LAGLYEGLWALLRQRGSCCVCGRLDTQRERGEGLQHVWSMGHAALLPCAQFLSMFPALRPSCCCCSNIFQLPRLAVVAGVWRALHSSSQQPPCSAKALSWGLAAGRPKCPGSPAEEGPGQCTRRSAVCCHCCSRVAGGCRAQGPARVGSLGGLCHWLAGGPAPTHPAGGQPARMAEGGKAAWVAAAQWSRRSGCTAVYR
jgi:hypothetical protein